MALRCKDDKACSRINQKYYTNNYIIDYTDNKNIILLTSGDIYVVAFGDSSGYDALW